MFSRVSLLVPVHLQLLAHLRLASAPLFCLLHRSDIADVIFQLLEVVLDSLSLLLSQLFSDVWLGWSSLVGKDQHLFLLDRSILLVLLCNRFRLGNRH